MRAAFNINDHVLVRVKESGHVILRQNYIKLMGNEAGYVGPKEDNAGYSRWQMWHLMQEFGPHIFLGGEVPFSPDIILEDAAPTQVGAA